MQMLFRRLHRQLRMHIAVALCAEAQNKRRDDETNDALFFGRENELVFQLLPLPMFGEFQRAICFTPERTRTDG